MEEFKKEIYKKYKNPKIYNKKDFINNDWFKQEYKRLTSYFGNTVTSSLIILFNNKNTFNRKIYLDFSKEKQKIMFNIIEDNIIGKIEVLWKPYENNLFNSIKINKLILVDNLQNEINISINCFNIKNYINNDGYINVDKKNPYIIFDIFTNEVIKKIIIEFTTKLSNNKYDNLIHYKHQNEKAQGYYDLLLKWIDIKHLNIDIKKHFIRNKYKVIGIYGNGEIGLRFYKEVENYSHRIFYISSESSYYPTNVNDFIEKKIECDVIIITPTFAYYSILQMLRKSGFNKDILSIEDVFNELLKLNG